MAELVAGRTRGYPSNTAGASTTPRSFNNSTYVIGMSLDNYYYPDRITNFSVTNDAVTITNTSFSTGAYGIAFPTDELVPGKFYRIKKCTVSGGVGNCTVSFYGGGSGQNPGRFISASGNGIFQVPIYTTQVTVMLYFADGSASQTISLTDFQLEEVVLP